MNFSKFKQEEIEEKLKKVRDYNQGKGVDPNFSTEEMREIRRYQSWMLENKKNFKSGVGE